MRVIITRTIRDIFLLSILLLVGCSKKEIHEGTLGNYYSIEAQAPFGMKNPSFAWFIAKIPA
ncbi:MAG: hypothetical protein V3U24_05420, partial [Candidatus Neomarinimicrobiota bacterium]